MDVTSKACYWCRKKKEDLEQGGFFLEQPSWWGTVKGRTSWEASKRPTDGTTTTIRSPESMASHQQSRLYLLKEIKDEIIELPAMPETCHPKLP